MLRVTEVGATNEEVHRLINCTSKENTPIQVYKKQNNICISMITNEFY